MSEFSIRGFISLDHSGMTKAFAKGGNELAKFKHDAESFGKGIGSSITSVFAGTTLTGMIDKLAGKVIEFFQVSKRYADEINDTSAALGIDPERLQETGFALSQTGGKLEDYYKAITKLSTLRQKAIEDDVESIETLRKLGITVDQVKGMSADQMFERMAEAIRETKNPTDQLAMAFDYFGKSGPKMLKAIKEGLGELRDEARKGGMIISREDLDILEAANDKTEALKQRAVTFAATVGAAALGFADKVNRGILSNGLGGFVHEMLVGLGTIDGTLTGAPSIGEETARGDALDKKTKAFNEKRAEGRKAPDGETEKDRRERVKKEQDAAEQRARRVDKLRVEVAEKQRRLALEMMTPEERLAELKREQLEAGKELFNDEEKRLEQKMKLMGLSEEIKRAEGEVARNNRPEKEQRPHVSLTENQRIGAYSSNRTLSLQQEMVAGIKTIAQNTKPTSQPKPMGGPKFS